MDDNGENSRSPTSSSPKFSDDEVLVDANAGSLRASKRGRNGFNVSKNNLALPRFRTATPLGSPMVRSPCLTIPPGISPTLLLDSPITLLNTQVRFGIVFWMLEFSCVSVLCFFFVRT